MVVGPTVPMRASMGDGGGEGWKGLRDGGEHL